MFVVFQILLVPLQMRQYEVFWGMAFLGGIVVLSELMYSRMSESRVQIRVDMSHVRNLRWREHALHHAVLPGLLYASGVLFMFFNRVRVLDQVAVVLLSGTFFGIFYNVSATYSKMYTITRNTRLIFDFINIIVFYFVTEALINAVVYEGAARSWIFVGGVLSTFILIGMMVSITKQSSNEIVAALVGTSIIVGVMVFGVWLIPVFNIAIISLVATVGFYLVDAFWHHRLEGSFSWDVMSQYALYALMAIILLLYL